MAFFLVLGLLVVVLCLYIYYRFLRALRDVLRAVNESNRTMRPDLVWLNFIPLFSLGWMFVTVIKIRDSVRAEYAYRGLRPEGDLGFGVGMTFAVTSVVSEIYVPFERSLNDAASFALTVISGIVGLASFICWLLYWSQASQLRDVLSVAVPAPGSMASPGYPVYEPAPWQMPPARQHDPTAADQQSEPQVSGQPAGGEPAPWLGARSSQEQPGPWLVAEPLAGHVQPGQAPGEQALVRPAGDCSFCGATYGTDAGYCRSCGRPAV